MTYNIEITPVDLEGIFGIFFSRSFAITESGVRGADAVSRSTRSSSPDEAWMTDERMKHEGSTG